MDLIATLPMYDHPGAREHTDRWWAGIAAHLRDAGIGSVPPSLSRGAPREDGWRSAQLLFSQTCGYPLVKDFAEHLTPLVTPCYDVPGCEGPYYSSLIVVREGDARSDLSEFAGAVCAVNGKDSQSGYNALRYMVAPLREYDDQGFFSSVLVSGVHASSLAMVGEGAADICAIDCVTHALIARYDPAALEGTRVLARTVQTPGLLYVTSSMADGPLVRSLREGLSAAFEDPALSDTREALFLGGAEVLELDAYAVLLEQEATALSSGHDPMVP